MSAPLPDGTTATVYVEPGSRDKAEAALKATSAEIKEAMKVANPNMQYFPSSLVISLAHPSCIVHHDSWQQ